MFKDFLHLLTVSRNIREALLYEIERYKKKALVEQLGCLAIQLHYFDFKLETYNEENWSKEHNGANITVAMFLIVVTNVPIVPESSITQYMVELARHMIMVSSVATFLAITGKSYNNTKLAIKERIIFEGVDLIPMLVVNSAETVTQLKNHLFTKSAKSIRVFAKVADVSEAVRQYAFNIVRSISIAEFLFDAFGQQWFSVKLIYAFCYLLILILGIVRMHYVDNLVEGSREPIKSMAAIESIALVLAYFTNKRIITLMLYDGGRIGYGREHCKMLLEKKGVMDVNDCCSCAIYLVDSEMIDGKHLCITMNSQVSMEFLDKFVKWCKNIKIIDILEEGARKANVDIAYLNFHDSGIIVLLKFNMGLSFLNMHRMWSTASLGYHKVTDNLYIAQLKRSNRTGDNGWSISDATMHSVKSTIDAFKLMKFGERNCMVSSSAFSDCSSRSYSVLIVHVKGRDTFRGTPRNGLHLVNLTGSVKVEN
ncbi:unnamed protein product [Malus baccata var. baccata]